MPETKPLSEQEREELRRAHSQSDSIEGDESNTLVCAVCHTPEDPCPIIRLLDEREGLSEYADRAVMAIRKVEERAESLESLQAVCHCGDLVMDHTIHTGHFRHPRLRYARAKFLERDLTSSRAAHEQTVCDATTALEERDTLQKRARERGREARRGAGAGISGSAGRGGYSHLHDVLERLDAEPTP